MLISLLLVLLLAHSIRSSEDVSLFDTSRCVGAEPEMACFVHGSCVDPPTAMLTQSKDKEKIDNCSVLLAIRVYSASSTKWLVVMRGKGIDQDGLHLFKVENSAESMLFECKINGDQSLGTVGSGLTSKPVSMFADPTGNYFHCELEVSFATALDSKRNLDMKLSYSIAQVGKQNEISSALFIGHVDSTVKCNPDNIKFTPESNDKENYAEVDSHRLSVTCPANWQLTYKKDTGYEPVDALTCEMDDTETDSKKKYKYKLGGTDLIPHGTQFSARCAQNRCIACPDVTCDQPDCKKPKWTPGAGDNCAILTCDDDSFEVSGDAGVKQFVGKATCRDGKWTVAASQPFTVASCSKKLTCPAICANCKKSQLAISCDSPDETMTITGPDGKSSTVDSLTCDVATGKWIDSTKKPVDGASSVSCQRVGSTTTASMDTGKMAGGVSILVVSLSGAILTAVLCYRIKRGRKKATATTSPAAKTATGSKKEKKSRRISKSSKSGGTEGTSSQGSGGKSAKSTKSKSLATAIPAKEATVDSLPELSPPRQSLPRPQAPPQQPTPRQLETPPSSNPPDNEAVPGGPKENDNGYVMIDPAEIAAHEAKNEAKKAAQAEKEKTGGTQKVGVLPPRNAAAAAAPPEQQPGPETGNGGLSSPPGADATPTHEVDATPPQ